MNTTHGYPASDYSVTWVSVRCPYCGTGNWVCLGNLTDITAPDGPSLLRCYACHKAFWMTAPVDDDAEGLDMDIMDGKEKP